MVNNKDVIDDPEFGVETRYESREERESESAKLMEARLMRMKNLSKDQIIRASLMQLKFQMEAYIQQPVDREKNNFSNFLRTYVDTIYLKRSKFAEDINITPIRLSQVINNHREPGEEFIQKLMIHTEKVFQNIGNIEKQIWYQVYYQEKIHHMTLPQDDWQTKLEKEIILSKLI